MEVLPAMSLLELDLGTLRTEALNEPTGSRRCRLRCHATGARAVTARARQPLSGSRPCQAALAASALGFPRSPSVQGLCRDCAEAIGWLVTPPKVVEFTRPPGDASRPRVAALPRRKASVGKRADRGPRTGRWWRKSFRPARNLPRPGRRSPPRRRAERFPAVRRGLARPLRYSARRT